eukprot:SAG22_NODE_449_length_10399_cov_43.159515_7_plen_263_part_00
MLAGKRALVTGALNSRSLGWAVARAWHAQGCQVALTCQDARARSHLEKLVASEWGEDATAQIVAQCDLTDDTALALAAEQVADRFGGELDAALHSVAYAPPGSFGKGALLQADKAAWAATMDASAYSLLALARHTRPLMESAGGGSLMALSFVGAVRACPAYGLMGPAKAALESLGRGLAAELGPSGIRVNTISPGPIKTVAARSIPGFGEMLREAGAKAPLRRTTSAEEVADVATFLASDASRALTGQTLYVDCGHSSVAM